ncbi:hypothetical protein ABK040_001313 [Willaertia magna]
MNFSHSSSSLITFFLKPIFKDPATKSLFYFIIINLLFMIVELFFGFYNNSLGLISDSAHMFFDCAALIIGLYGNIMSKWKSNSIYTYGYVRYEYLSGFINGILLIFISIYILIESIHRLFDPPIVSTNQLLIVSIIGLFINLYGVFHFHQHHHHGDECSHQHGHHHHHNESCNHHHSEHHHHDENIYGVYLHMLADALGSVSVIISTLIVQYFNIYIADPICSLIISIFILLTSFPLIISSSRVLLQRSPIQLDNFLNEVTKQILQMDSIIQINNIHVWTLKSNKYIGSLKVLVKEDVNEIILLQNLHNLFTNIDMTIEIEKPTQIV